MNTKKTVLVVLALTFIAKILGFLRDLFITNYVGFGAKTDALLLSLSIVTVIFSTFNTVIRTTFSPMFSLRYFKEKVSTLKDYNNIRNILIITSLIVSLIIMIFSKQVILVFAPGLSVETLSITTIYLRLFAILLLFYNVYYLTTGFLQSIKVFTTVETANVINNVLIIITIILLYKFIGVYSIIFGYILGSIFQMIYSSFIFSKKVKYKLNFKCDIKDESWKNFLANSKFVLFGSLVAQVNTLADKFVASFLSEGSISALHYAKLINNLPLTIVILAITNILFTKFSLTYKRNSDSFKKLVVNQLKTLLYIIIPFVLIMFVFSEEIVKILFYRGEFSMIGVKMTSSALKLYSIGLFFWVIKDVYTKISYSAKDTKSPFIISVSSLIINLVLNFALGFYYGHVGIALATSVSILINSFLLILVLHKRNIISFGKKDVVYLFRILIVFFVMLFLLLIVKSVLIKFQSDFLNIGTGTLFVIIIWLLFSRFIGVNISALLKRRK